MIQGHPLGGREGVDGLEGERLGEGGQWKSQGCMPAFTMSEESRETTEQGPRCWPALGWGRPQGKSVGVKGERRRDTELEMRGTMESSRQWHMRIRNLEQNLGLESRHLKGGSRIHDL